MRLGLGYDGSNGTWNAAIAPRDGSPENEASISLKRDTTGDEPDIVFGPPYDTRIVARNVSAELHLRELGEPSVEAIATIEGLGLVITNRWFRSLGDKGSALREGLRFNANLEARLTEGAGFSFSADGALAALIHVDKKFELSVLKLRVHSILVNVPIHATQNQFDVRVEVRPHWSATGAFITLVMDATSRPEKFGMVRLDGDGRALEIVDKPRQTTLTLMWGCIIWRARFTEHLHACVRDRGASDFARILNEAIGSGMRVRGYTVADGSYADLGTYEEIRELDASLRQA